MDALGDTIEQLCLPTPYRHKCLTLAHDKFGHAGHNKMNQHIKRYFYWPSTTVDAAKQIRSCDTCQRKDKNLPKRMTMQRREIVTMPAERVAICSQRRIQIPPHIFRHGH